MTKRSFKSGTIILLQIDENSEVGFYNTIFILGLVINLRVKGSKKPSLDSKALA